MSQTCRKWLDVLKSLLSTVWAQIRFKSWICYY